MLQIALFVALLPCCAAPAVPVTVAATTGTTAGVTTAVVTDLVVTTAVVGATIATVGDNADHGHLCDVAWERCMNFGVSNPTQSALCGACHELCVATGKWPVSVPGGEWMAGEFLCVGSQ
jgi:hypothetical protein